jgi:hypothetical protein
VFQVSLKAGLEEVEHKIETLEPFLELDRLEVERMIET